MSKSLSQMPYVAYHPQPPSSASPTASAPTFTLERMSISSLMNAVENTRITTATSPLQPTTTRVPSRSRRPSDRGRTDAVSPHGSHGNNDTSRRRKVQSEKKRMWRKNMSPEQKLKRQQQDAHRKREQRLNMSVDQRAEARRKDAARKAAKRKIQKQDHIRHADEKTSSSSPSPPVQRVPSPHSSPPIHRVPSIHRVPPSHRVPPIQRATPIHGFPFRRTADGSR